MTIQEIFDSTKEHGKDKTILAMVQHGKISITEALREYTACAKSAGMILGTKERAVKVNEFLAEHSAEDIQDSAKRKKLTENISDNFEVSLATAAQHIKTYCAGAEIALPEVHRTSLEDMVAFVKGKLDAGVEREELLVALQDELGYTENSASSAFSRAAKELGISTGSRKQVPMADVVSFLRTNRSMNIDALAEKMAEELGYAASTSKSVCGFLAMLDEWEKQENETDTPLKAVA